VLLPGQLGDPATARVEWLPKQYAAISDTDSFFTTLGEEVAREIDDLTDELVGEIKQSDSYLAHVGRLFAARAIAEELIWSQSVLPDPELTADDQDDMPAGSGRRPMVVNRDHPSWAEVNAEQQERIHGPAADWVRCQRPLLPRTARTPRGTTRGGAPRCMITLRPPTSPVLDHRG
jgi:hypothetical protein